MRKNRKGKERGEGEGGVRLLVTIRGLWRPLEDNRGLQGSAILYKLERDGKREREGKKRRERKVTGTSKTYCQIHYNLDIFKKKILEQGWSSPLFWIHDSAGFISTISNLLTTFPFLLFFPFPSFYLSLNSLSWMQSHGGLDNPPKALATLRWLLPVLYWPHSPSLPSSLSSSLFFFLIYFYWCFGSNNQTTPICHWYSSACPELLSSSRFGKPWSRNTSIHLSNQATLQSYTLIP